MECAGSALRHLGLEPLLEYGMRLGEGSGAVAALPILKHAVAVLSEMATFGDAGVSDKGDAAPAPSASDVPAPPVEDRPGHREGGEQPSQRD